MYNSLPATCQDWCYSQSTDAFFVVVVVDDDDDDAVINITSLQWRHNEHNRVPNHQPHDCLLNRLFRRRSKKTSKLRVTGLCAGNSSETGQFPAQMGSNAEMFPFDDVIVWRVEVKADYISRTIWYKNKQVSFRWKVKFVV